MLHSDSFEIARRKHQLEVENNELLKFQFDFVDSKDSIQ